MIENYSHYFKNKIKLFLTCSDKYWDEIDSVRENKISDYIQYEGSKVIMPNQIHGDKIVVASNDFDRNECDAIIFNGKSNLVGAINVADCMPICIYDSNNNYIALVHSGWKGTLKKITIKTICKMLDLGSDRGSLKIFIGPSIRGCCYQVGESFVSDFSDSCITSKGGSFYLDLASQLLLDLKNENIPKNNIFMNESCTFDSLNYHSFRRDGGLSGRMSLIAYMKNG